ncbi:MBL fold metallo-hydrolase [candidate division KSB1 bacterium]|nr:MBL fold metallo-hydrolase [candidate division KSB1 bacterium]
MKIGKFDIKIATDGFFKLDGGAMFGVVPKPLWNKTDPADERNRILLSMDPLVIRFDNEIFIVDTGIGEKWDDKNLEILGIDRNTNLVKSLKEMEISKNDVTGVILTHLHFDHAGGATEKGENGKYRPVFPNARYYIQKNEWDFAVNSNERTAASYLPENFLPIEEYGQVHFLKGDGGIVDGIRVEITGGHTPYHQMVIIKSEGQTACYVGDIIPTRSHIKLAYIMGYDLNPMDTLKAKKKLIANALKENWLIVFPHSPRMKAGYFEETEKGVSLKPVDLNE